MVDLNRDIVIRMEDSSLNLRTYKHFLFEQKYWKEYLKVRDCKNAFIENDKEHGVPPMNLIFYGYFKMHHKPPTWQVFMEMYKREFVIETNTPGVYAFNDGVPKHCDYTATMPEIDRKIMNGYMSFLKEGYVFHWLWEHGLSEAYYSREMDKCGFDICVERHNGEWLYGIRVYCKTDSAEHYAKIKDNERLVRMRRIVSIKFEIEVFNKDTRVMAGDTCIAPDSILKAISYLIKQECEYDFTAYSAETVNPQIMNGG